MLALEVFPQPDDAVGNLCKQYNAIFHSDTVQTVGHYPFNLRNTPVHFITGAAHKFHGPKGAGILYINENVKINPLLQGGSQERNMRAGTENLYGIVALQKHWNRHQQTESNPAALHRATDARLGERR